MVGIEFYVYTSKGYLFVPPVDALTLAVRDAAYEAENRPKSKTRC